MTKVLANDWHASKSQEAICLRPFYSVRDRLSISNNLVIYSYEQGPARVVIPEALRTKIAANLHAGHQGLDSMQRRARQIVYWPGMEGDLSYHRSTCTACNTSAPSQPAEPLVMTPPPEYPFQKTTADLCQINGCNYLVYADRLTGWIEIAHLPGDTTSGKLIQHFRGYFARYGAPKEVSIDGGTNLVSEEMSTFFKCWGVHTRVSSAYYPQSNGRAEAAVKTAKRILMDNTGPGGSLNTDKVSVALLQYYNTPLRDINLSPAQLATGRQLRDGVPADRQHYKVNYNWRRTLREREVKLAEAHKEVVRKSGIHRTLPPISTGARVWVQNQTSLKWDRSGTVTEALENRQYTVKLDGSGRISRRNRKHLKIISEPAPANITTPSATTGTAATPNTQPVERPQRRTKQPDRLTYYSVKI